MSEKKEKQQMFALIADILVISMVAAGIVGGHQMSSVHAQQDSDDVPMPVVLSN